VVDGYYYYSDVLIDQNAGGYDDNTTNPALLWRVGLQ
jgi:hypothetical protein